MKESINEFVMKDRDELIKRLRRDCKLEPMEAQDVSLFIMKNFVAKKDLLTRQDFKDCYLGHHSVDSRTYVMTKFEEEFIDKLYALMGDDYEK